MDSPVVIHRAPAIGLRIKDWRARVADLRGRGIYAGYANDHHCIFIHIPKTAGSSVAQALFGVNSRHVPVEVYRDANPRKFERFFKFAFVRNPWDRLVSTYTFLLRGGMNDADAAFAAEHVQPYDRFDAFVRAKLEDPTVLGWVHFRPQTSFICAADGSVLMDFVGRYEQLQTDFDIVARRLGKVSSLPQINVSDHERYTEYYDAASREIVSRLYASDIECFDYKFNP